MPSLKGFSTIFGSESGKVIRRKTLLHSKQCYNLYSSLYKVILFYDNSFCSFPVGNYSILVYSIHQAH